MSVWVGEATIVHFSGEGGRNYRCASAAVGGVGMGWAGGGINHASGSSFMLVSLLLFISLCQQSTLSAVKVDEAVLSCWLSLQYFALLYLLKLVWC